MPNQELNPHKKAVDSTTQVKLTDKIKKLRKNKKRLINQLLDSTNTKEQFIEIRSQYYRVTSDLYYAKKGVNQHEK